MHIIHPGLPVHLIVWYRSPHINQILHRTPGVLDDVVRSRGNAVSSADVETTTICVAGNNLVASQSAVMWGWGGISGANTPRARYVHRPVPLPISFIELHRVGSDRRPCERGAVIPN
ncbi:hypothetical protein OPV22_014762 [Ensete ventricosum]|uniref:Uncharacterized protein n=1 Tax=Ensete ventricosum TaxID=4639 RepID=A0AAV8R6S3_ENSVE|nr:hypothetical protein OPV22_014762 [Ensete ventricosum]